MKKEMDEVVSELSFGEQVKGNHMTRDGEGVRRG